MRETQVPGNPARQITHLARLITRYFDRRLSPLGITVANLSVLGALRCESPRSQKELTEIGRIGQPAMAQMLDRLMREGLLVRMVDAVDRRKAMFALSPRAQAVMATVETHLNDGNADVFSPLSQDEMATLMHLVQRLEQHLASRPEIEP